MPGRVAKMPGGPVLEIDYGGRREGTAAFRVWITVLVTLVITVLVIQLTLWTATSSLIDYFREFHSTFGANRKVFFESDQSTYELRDRSCAKPKVIA
eukprot:1366854-Amorphochlora_amoeboformis.AAC.1